MKSKCKRLVALLLSTVISLNVLSVGASASEFCPHANTYETESPYGGESATCTEDGYQDYSVYCEDCDQFLETRREVIKATGHSFSEPEFDWDGTDCYITVECQNDECWEYAWYEECKVTSKVTKAASYAANGTKVYTATYQLGGETFKTTKTVKLAKLTVAKPTLKSVQSKKKKTLAAQWSKNAKATGYEIQYSKDKKFKKSVKSQIIKKNSTTSVTLKSLNAKTTYYVRVRAYTTASKKKYYSAWSNVKSAKAQPAKKSTQTASKKPSVGSTVYITRTGKKYHTHKCGNGTFYQVSLSEAKSKGLTPCKKCF